MTNKALNEMNIQDIENMTLAAAKAAAVDHVVIKEHDIYFVDFGGYFKFSALVFYGNAHIYHANDYELHHKFKDVIYPEDENGETVYIPHTHETLKEYYINALNNKLYTEAEIYEPLKNYDEYTKKDYFLRNYYSMREKYISMFFIGSDDEREKLRRKVSKMYYSPIAFAYYYDPDIVDKINELHIALQKQRANTVNSYEYNKAAFLYEMFNHEYGYNWEADLDTLSAFGLPFHGNYNCLDDMFDRLNFTDIQRRAYRDARTEYYKTANL